jgi:hypothetical protein
MPALVLVLVLAQAMALVQGLAPARVRGSQQAPWASKWAPG